MDWIGLDVGGANLKAADTNGNAVTRSFALWRHPDRLRDELHRLLDRLPAPAGLALTMTGELCDCFSSKAEGVLHIIGAVEEIVGRAVLSVWTTEGRFREAAWVREHPTGAAAANWLALATWSARWLEDGPGLVLDMGSTTTDLVPIVNRQPVPRGRCDPDRLDVGELVYCGVRRTPLCAIFGLSKAAEFFATTEDVYLALGDLDEDATRNDTADGRPATRTHALMRLARMNCDDVGDGQKALALARQACELQVVHVAGQLRRVIETLPGPVRSVVLAGSGEFLFPRILERAGLADVPRVSLRARLGAEFSTAACAHAVAVLAREQA